MTTSRTERAKPLSGDERRAAILDAVLPLIMARGRDVTSRQLAEAAGVAEGTIFRAFGDKDTLIQAAVEKYLEPEVLVAGLRAIDPSLPLEMKLRLILDLLRERFRGVFGVMQAVGMTQRPTPRESRNFYPELVAELLAPNLDELAVTPETVARFIRMIAFATSITPFTENGTLEPEELAFLIHHGIAGKD